MAKELVGDARHAFVQEAWLELASGIDPRSVGAAVTGRYRTGRAFHSMAVRAGGSTRSTRKWSDMDPNDTGFTPSRRQQALIQTLTAFPYPSLTDAARAANVPLQTAKPWPAIRRTSRSTCHAIDQRAP